MHQYVSAALTALTLGFLLIHVAHCIFRAPDYSSADIAPLEALSLGSCTPSIVTACPMYVAFTIPTRHISVITQS